MAWEWTVVSVWDETLIEEHAAETLTQLRVAVETDWRRLCDIADPRFFPTGHASPQPFLARLEETVWHPDQRQALYRPWRKRLSAKRQAPLSEPDRETASG